MDEDSLAW